MKCIVSFLQNDTEVTLCFQFIFCVVIFKYHGLNICKIPIQIFFLSLFEKLRRSFLNWLTSMCQKLKVVDTDQLFSFKTCLTISVFENFSPVLLYNFYYLTVYTYFNTYRNFFLKIIGFIWNKFESLENWHSQKVSEI